MGGGTRERCKWLGGVGEKRNGERLGKEKHKKSKQNKTNKATIKNKMIERESGKRRGTEAK